MSSGGEKKPPGRGPKRGVKSAPRRPPPTLVFLTLDKPPGTACASSAADRRCAIAEVGDGLPCACRERPRRRRATEPRDDVVASPRDQSIRPALWRFSAP